MPNGIGNYFIPTLSDYAGNTREQAKNQIDLALSALRLNNGSIAEKILTTEASSENPGINEKARYLLALLYLHGGEGVQKNIPEAIKLLQSIDSSDSNYILGALYFKGLYDTQKDTSLGLSYLEKAGAQGNPLANTLLGLIYFKGDEGIIPDQKKATDFLNTGSAYESRVFKCLSSESRFALAEYAILNDSRDAPYWIEKGVPDGKDKKELYQKLGDYKWSKKRDDSSEAIQAWTKMADNIPHPVSSQDQEQLTKCGHAVYCEAHRTEERAFKFSQAAAYWQRAAEAGYPAAQYYLGLANITGKGVETNKELGKQWLEKVAEVGFLPAKTMLNHLAGIKLSLDQLIVPPPLDLLKLPPLEEKDFLKTTGSFLSRAVEWIKDRAQTITMISITTVAIAALIAGLTALTICFPAVMIPIWIGTGALAFATVGLGGFLLAGFAAGGH